uniref:Uncharacterized protein n=1 Tax=Sphaerodactylus townsendi TaxID=933632 RepID=A0ACB8FQX8_9SAUR
MISHLNSPPTRQPVCFPLRQFPQRFPYNIPFKARRKEIGRQYYTKRSPIGCPESRDAALGCTWTAVVAPRVTPGLSDDAGLEWHFRWNRAGQSARDQRKLSFYPFPLNDKERLEKWLRNMKRDTWIPSKHQVLCSDHFTPDSLDVRWGIRYLKTTAVPTIFSAPDNQVNYNRAN